MTATLAVSGEISLKHHVLWSTDPELLLLQTDPTYTAAFTFAACNQVLGVERCCGDEHPRHYTAVYRGKVSRVAWQRLPVQVSPCAALAPATLPRGSSTQLPDGTAAVPWPLAEHLAVTQANAERLFALRQRRPPFNTLAALRLLAPFIGVPQRVGLFVPCSLQTLTLLTAQSGESARRACQQLSDAGRLLRVRGGVVLFEDGARAPAAEAAADQAGSTTIEAAKSSVFLRPAAQRPRGFTEPTAPVA